MRFAIPGLLLAATVFAAGVAASHAFPPTAGTATASATAATSATGEPAPVHRIRITVSGPADTLMHVRRGSAQSHAALEGEPFDFRFTEPAGARGYPGITVSAASARPRGTPVRCAIVIDGVTVAEQATAQRDDSGYAQVQCRVPRPV